VPHPNPYPRCIFCDAKANSREHAIPAWIGKRFGMRAVKLSPIYTFNLQHLRKQPVVFGSHRERICCKGCNEHFKYLEDDAIPVVEWMARGKSITLGTAEQDVLARWGAKTGYALIAAEKDFRELLPVEHRRMLRDEGKVHPLTWVGYASWNGSAHKHGGDHSLSGRPEEPTVRSYGAILTFAQLAFKVFGLYAPVPRHTLLFDTASLKQVHPPLDRPIAWPLWPPASDANIQSMAELPTITPTPTFSNQEAK
jgi:hypothetical protein